MGRHKSTIEAVFQCVGSVAVEVAHSFQGGERDRCLSNSNQLPILEMGFMNCHCSGAEVLMQTTSGISEGCYRYPWGPSQLLCI